MVKRLTAYRIHASGPTLVPGQARRQWMDDTNARFAYRCLPLIVANSMGWELLLPAGVTAEWNGGTGLGDISVESNDPNWTAKQLAQSHFGHGVLTFPISYLFRTDPGIAIWARGVPNRPKDGIAPLDGIIETDWLDFTFTMNWQFTRPGRVVFEKDEPFCFITPIAYRALDCVVPEIVPMSEAPEVAERYTAYSEARQSFNKGLAESDPATVKEAWQKWYMRGENPGGGKGNPLHISKLSLAEPVEKAPSHSEDGQSSAQPEPIDAAAPIK